MALPSPPASDDPQGRFTFVGSSGGDTHGRFDTRPAGFGRGRELQTPQPRLKHQALTGAPPAANRSYSTTAAASAHVPPASGIPARDTPEFLAECAKMAAIEDSVRRAGTTSSTRSSRRRNKVVDEADEDTLEPTSKGTLETTTPPTSDHASAIALESTSKHKGHFGGDACASFRSRL